MVRSLVWTSAMVIVAFARDTSVIPDHLHDGSERAWRNEVRWNVTL